MNTAEMVLLADKNGETYYINTPGNIIFYKPNIGFCDNRYKSIFKTDYISDFIHLNGWKLNLPKYTHDDLVKLIGHDFEYIFKNKNPFLGKNDIKPDAFE